MIRVVVRLRVQATAEQIPATTMKTAKAAPVHMAVLSATMSVAVFAAEPFRHGWGCRLVGWCRFGRSPHAACGVRSGHGGV